jgi:GTPase SAR1 family protein
LIVPKPNSWLDLHRQRHDWALTAFDRFVRELAPELSAQLKGAEQVTVVVYGATQVGKTTLILDLLGLASDTQSETALVLRGEQAVGKSATVMPLRYGRSSDDYWYIGGSGPLDPEAAAKALAKARREVEDGDRQEVVLTDILIPARLFTANTKDALKIDVRLIDLPGLDARNAHERELVAALARRYVTVADLVLLVTQASSLSFIRPERLELEELANWMHQPVRFRVVITSCFSLSSVRDFLLKSACDEAGLRALMIKEIQTLDLTIPPYFHENIYLLELGDSANRLAVKDRNYFSIVSPLVDAARLRLIADIKRSSGPFSRLFAAFQLDQIVTGQIAAFQADYDKRRGTLEAEFEDFKIQIGKRYSLPAESDFKAGLLERLDELETECSTAKLWREVVDFLLDKNNDELIESIFPVQSVREGKQSVAILQEALSDEKTRLRDRYRNCNLALEEALVDAIGGEAQMSLHAFIETLSFDDFDDSDFLTLEHHLDDYSTDGYWFTSTYETDLAMLQYGIERSRLLHIKLAHNHFIDSLQLEKQSQTGVLPPIRAQQRQITAKIDAWDTYEAQLAGLYTELEKNIARMHDSKEIAQHFERRIEEGFAQALTTSTAEIVTSKTPTEKFLALMNSHLIITEAEKLYSGKSST